MAPLSPHQARRRNSDETPDNDEYGQLTEVAIPQPVTPEDTSHPALEDYERRFSRATPQAELEPEIVLPEGPATRDQFQDEEQTSNNDKRQHEKPVQSGKPSAFFLELYTVSWLIFFSFLGTLARLGVETITLYPNSPFSSRVVWANVGGSFVIGVLAEDRQLFRHEWGAPDPKAPLSEHAKVKKTIPLYIGLATGFCGSFTSFSSFIRDAFLAMTNSLQSPSLTSPYHVDSVIAPRNGGFSFLALLAILIVHPALSLAALMVGAQLALLAQPVTPTIPFGFLRKVLDPLGVLLAFGGWLGAVLLAIWPPGNETRWRAGAVFPLVFAPLGCLLRYYASKHMNGLIPAFPLGTFTVNLFGTAVLGMAYDLQHANSIGASNAISCAVLQGIMEGFCGCLTTVSTWVAELHGLRRRHGWIYGLVSVAAGLGLMVIIMGSMKWTVGYSTPVCS
ncbi:hypothetical protein PV10_04589 [Exophiala mesophila]|uniref:Uncharacterized protein n=1 Tax=Exophiala mesophila TaxID=212818 RepID=A0A0D2A2V0_EXOME|nr:uncharacterized protein PV10_04589 [Exophiala mesophila]KIV93373.1 hypothetical protein PV10_04589 [Exophiala mesophila]